MSDLISRQMAIEAVQNRHIMLNKEKVLLINDLEKLPSAQPEIKRQAINSSDCIDRQSAIDALRKLREEDIEDYGCEIPEGFNQDHLDRATFAINQLPSAQPEPLSDAYMNAVWAWLIDYQIKAAKLKGRYTPYEVLSWVANDWRKEHERSDQQTGSD